MTRKVIFTPDDYWTTPKEPTMTQQDPYINLAEHIQLHLEDDGLKLGLIPHDGGIGVLITLTTDLGRFVVGLSPDHLVTLYGQLKSMATQTPEQHQATYNELLALHQKGNTE